MNNTDSFKSKTFLEQWVPRIVAIIVLGYIVYSLFIKRDEFSWIYVIALAMVTTLILAPMTSRLKVLDIIDFNSKLDGVKKEQQETKAQLKELGNQISTVVSTRVSPTQIISLQGIQELISNNFEGKKQLAPDEANADRYKHTKTDFLLRANGYRYRAFTLLYLTRSFQIATIEHRQPGLITEGSTTDEKIKYLIDKILENNLKTVIPITLIDQKSGDEKSVITPEVIEGLRKISLLLDLYQKIESDKQELPQQPIIDDMFNKVGEALNTIALGLEIVGSDSILFHYRMTNAFKALEKEIEQADAEDRPIRLPPKFD